MDLPLTGGCLCGAVRYQVTDPPLGVYACHCTDCQRITSSAFSLGVVVPADAFQVVGQDARLVAGGTAASGRVKRRWICAACGVWLFGDPRPNTEGPGLVRVVRSGTFDDTAWIKPRMHFWTRSAQSWLALDGITYQTQPEELDT